MHEYALVEALVGRVEAEARERRALAVHRITVSVGELAGVDPDLFRTAYETFRQGTSLESAPLELRSVAARWSCPACGVDVPGGAALRCPRCGEPARLREGGDEILLEAIEMEVP